MIIATAGHVDHGKTSLVKALTGIETDRLDEEKKRGLTIELGFAYSPPLGFIDVPGHTKFINTMIAGVHCIDHALVVIAADDGLMPQTHEHLEILNLLGVKRFTYVITKCDKQKAESFQFDHPTFYASSKTGEGIQELKKHLLEEAKKTSPKKSTGAFRLSIDRKFILDGFGLILTGAVIDGNICVNDTLTLLPHFEKVRVRSLFVKFTYS